MKTRIVLYAGFLLAITGVGAFAAPSLKMPVQAGEFWIMSRGYSQTSHVNYGSTTTQDTFALDFTQSGCFAYGKEVLAVASGVVEFAGWQSSYGNTILLNHGNGYKSRYAHLSDSAVLYGQQVEQGQKIGEVGDTGSVEGSQCDKWPGTHLHFAMYHNGNAYKPEPMDGQTGIGNINGALFFSSNYRLGSDNVDAYCKENYPDPRVERFRSSSGGLVVNSCPSDGKAYYYYDKPLCHLSYINVSGADGSGGYEICGGSSYVGEDYGNDPTSDGNDTTPIGPNPQPISGPRVDLRPDFDIKDLDGDELSSNCDNYETKPLRPNQEIKLVLTTQVSNEDAGNFKRDDDSNSIEGPIWYRMGAEDSWHKIASQSQIKLLTLYIIVFTLPNNPLFIHIKQLSIRIKLC